MELTGRPVYCSTTGAEEPTMRNATIPTTLVGVALLTTAAVMTAWPEQPPREPEPAAALRVVTAPVEATDASRRVRLAGVTRAADRANLAFTLPARLAERPVDIGDSVTAGQVLARLDDTEVRLAERAAAAALTELEARLDQARRDAGRVERLAAARAATVEELEQVRSATAALQAARDAAAARADDARRRVVESTLRAPFAGTVVAVHLEPGEWAAPGAPIVELAGSGALEVVVEVPEAVRARLALGQPVDVRLPFVDRSVDGRVTAGAEAAAGAGGLCPVEVSLGGDGDVLPGLAAEVALELTPRPALTVPLEAVVNPGATSPAVFRISDGRALRVPVTLGEVLGDRVAVRGELAAGDRVAVAGHTVLASGDRVEVAS
jgi:RND family efflux transporter MFP subunit